MLEEVLGLLGQLLGPYGLTVALIIVVAYGARFAYRVFKDLWTEHFRVDHERRDALLAANARTDAMRESNDANARIMEKAVAQNERLVAAVLQAERRSDADAR